MMDICKACSGHCCNGFSLSHKVDGEDMCLIKKDTEYIHEHIGDFMEFNHEDDTVSWWKCNRFDSEVKLCSMYDERPNLCKSYHCEDYDSIMYLVLTDKHEVMSE